MPRVLVVDDLPENIAAAQQFFESIGIEIEIGTTVEEAATILQGEEDFLAAIIDVELPRSSGGAPEAIGWEVGILAKKLRVPYVHLTGGVGDHTDTSYIGLEPGLLFYKGGPEKSQPRAWESAWEFLSVIDLQCNYDSRVRYRHATGRQAQR